MRKILTIATAGLAAVLLCGHADAQSNATTNQATGLKLSGDKPIQIESDKLEVDQNKNMAVFTGDVSVLQDKTLLKAGRMTVYYTKQDEDKAKPAAAAAPSQGAFGQGASNIDRIEAEGKVYVKSDDQVATGDRGTFDMKAQVLVLSGDKVVLTQGDNVIVGCKLTVHTQSGQARLDGCQGGSGGRVKMLLKPESKGKQ